MVCFANLVPKTVRVTRHFLFYFLGGPGLAANFYQKRHAERTVFEEEETITYAVGRYRSALPVTFFLPVLVFKQ